MITGGKNPRGSKTLDDAWSTLRLAANSCTASILFEDSWRVSK